MRQSSPGIAHPTFRDQASELLEYSVILRCVARPLRLSHPTAVFHGWHTPPELFSSLEGIVGSFDLDPCTPDDCSGPVRARIKFRAADDGLSREWFGKVYMNPPYGRQIRSWIAKARAEASRGVSVVGLIPARTDTAWWHDHIADVADIVFLKGRLAFGDGKAPAPFPSALALWGFESSVTARVAVATGGFSVLRRVTIDTSS